MPVYLGVNGEVKKISTIQYKNENGIVIEPLTPDAGKAIFTTSGIFTVPEGVTSIDVFLVGGGGAGGYSSQRITNTGGWWWYLTPSGGGGGYTKTIIGISVTPGEDIAVTVGAGSTKSETNWVSPYNWMISTGGTSSCKGYSALGGYSGGSGSIKNAGNGGSGSGSSGIINFNTDGSLYTSNGGGKGGSDGSNGYTETTLVNTDNDHTCNLGQVSTTRAFGDLGNTLYAGGGAGCQPLGYSKNGSGNTKWYTATTGGAGGGGNSCIGYDNGNTGSPGTDGTGGGGGGSAHTSNISKGGDGIVIIRWGHVG